MTRQKTRIAIVSDAVLPFNKGGKETRIKHLTTELAKNGNEVHIYTMNWWQGDKIHTIDGITFHALSRLYPLYSNDRRSIKQGLWFGIACLKLLLEDFDVLEVDHMPFFPLYTTKIVSLIKGKPLFATWHEVWGKAYWREYLGPIKGSIAYSIERLSVLLPNHIVAVSAHTEKQLRSVLAYKGPTRVISNGIEYDKIKKVVPAVNSSDIIFVGRLLAHKNVALLISTIARLVNTRPSLRCIIIGEGPEYDRIKRLVKAKGLQNNVKMLGFLASSDEVFAHMKASKVFVLPSFREGFGIAVLEAFACGLSVVTVKHRDNAAQHLVLPSMGIVCEPTIEDIASAIESLLSAEANSANDLSTTPAEYDWSLSARALTEVYGL